MNISSPHGCIPTLGNSKFLKYFALQKTVAFNNCLSYMYQNDVNEAKGKYAFFQHQDEKQQYADGNAKFSTPN